MDLPYGFSPGPPTASATLTRPPSSPMERLVRGQRITYTHGDFTGKYRVTEVQAADDGSETYTLEPAADVDAAEAAGRVGLVHTD